MYGWSVLLSRPWEERKAIGTHLYGKAIAPLVNKRACVTTYSLFLHASVSKCDKAAYFCKQSDLLNAWV